MERDPAPVVDRVFNFSAGPAVMPVEVLEEARDDLLCLPGVGSSILEISHRSPAFDRILGDTLGILSDLLGGSADHEILLLQGGASLQFSMVPMNLLRGESTADYILTGTWGTTAARDARREGRVHVAWDGASTKHDRLPAADEISLSDDPAYVHITSNETIQGVQWKREPHVGTAPLVCDASSDFLSRPIDLARYGLIYACAQKNLGPSGMTMMLVRDDVLAACRGDIPKIFRFGALSS